MYIIWTYLDINQNINIYIYIYKTPRTQQQNNLIFKKSKRFEKTLLQR